MYTKILHNVLFPVGELVFRTSIQKRLDFLMESQYWPKAKMEQYQNRRLRELIQHAYDNVPYYRNMFISLGLKPSDIKTKKDLKKLPILTKDSIKMNFENLLARGYKDKSYPTYTSGSTGVPMVFYQTKEDYGWIWGAHFRKLTWTGCEYGDRNVKMTLVNTREMTKKKLQDKVMRCHYIYANKMDDESIRKYIMQIQSYKPKFLYAYSSALNILANYIKKNRMEVNVPTVISTGDKLVPNYRKNIEEAFHTKVYDEYGCGGEGLNIAAQCSRGHYHVNDELMIIEVINKQVIATSLNNYAMPLIRYNLCENVTLGKDVDCEIKLSTIRNIEGRSKETVFTSKGNITVHFFCVMFELLKGVEQFKVIQAKKEGITILIVKNELFDGEEKIRSEIRKAAGNDFLVQIKYVERILPDKNGKTKIIDNRLKDCDCFRR